jgi:hypothetical protein
MRLLPAPENQRSDGKLPLGIQRCAAKYDGKTGVSRPIDDYCSLPHVCPGRREGGFRAAGG